MSKKTQLWVGRILFILPVLFLAFDAAIHIVGNAQVTSASQALGYSPSVMLPLGIVELICLILYVYPRTSVLGAILLTGYLGGAVATHVRVESPLFGFILFPVYVGIMIWGALYLRDERVKALIPFKKF